LLKDLNAIYRGYGSSAWGEIQGPKRTDNSVSVKRGARIAIGLTPRCWASKRIVSEPIPPGVATAMASTIRFPAE